MALFGKKKLSLDEILEGVDKLTPEEQEKVKAKMDDLYKAEDEREIDKVEDEKADDEDVKDEKEEEVDEESEEIAKDVDEVEEEVETDEESKEADKGGFNEWKTLIEREINELKAKIESFKREPKEADKGTQDKLSELAKKFD